MSDRYPIRRDPRWRPLLAPFGASEERSYVEVDEDEVRFRFGFRPMCRLAIPREEIESAGESSWPTLGGIGWRLNFRGTAGLVGSRQGIVELTLATPIRARIAGLPVKLRRVFVSVEEPEALLAALNPDRYP